MPLPNGEPRFPNPAPGPKILNQQSWAPEDKSGIFYDEKKLETMPVSLYETDGYKENVGPDGWEVERVYLCDWSDVAAAMQWLYGYSTLEDQRSVNTGARPDVPSRTITRVTPAQDPYRPYLYCDHVELVEGMGAWVQDPGLFQNRNDEKTLLPGMVYAEVQGLGTPDVQFSDGIAKLRAQFRQRPYIVQTDDEIDPDKNGELARYVERQAHFAMQGMPLAKVASSGNVLQFSVGGGAPAGLLGKQIPEAGVLLMPSASYHYIWHDVPFFPSSAIANVVGRVNNAPFDGLAGWPLLDTQTLLCMPPEISWRRNIAGQVAFTIKWILDWRPGWNKFPAGDGGTYGATFGGGAAAADGSNLVYKPVDFGQLFKTQVAAAWL